MPAFTAIWWPGFDLTWWYATRLIYQLRLELLFSSNTQRLTWRVADTKGVNCVVIFRQHHTVVLISSDLNPQKHNIQTAYGYLLTFLHPVVDVRFDRCEGEASSIAHFSIYVLVLSTWWWWNGTKGTCRKWTTFLWIVTQRGVIRCVTTPKNVYFAAEARNHEWFRKVNKWSYWVRVLFVWIWSAIVPSCLKSHYIRDSPLFLETLQFTVCSNVSGICSVLLPNEKLAEWLSLWC